MINKKNYKELDNLHRAISSIPGIKISNRVAIINEKVYVWIYAYDQKLLFPIARATSHRYGSIQFNFQVYVADIPDEWGNVVCYELSSKFTSLQDNLAEAIKLANFIDDYMRLDRLLIYSGMDKVIESYKIANRDNKLEDIL